MKAGIVFEMEKGVAGGFVLKPALRMEEPFSVLPVQYRKDAHRVLEQVLRSFYREVARLGISMRGLSLYSDFDERVCTFRLLIRDAKLAARLACKGWRVTRASGQEAHCCQAERRVTLYLT